MCIQIWVPELMGPILIVVEKIDVNKMMLH